METRTRTPIMGCLLAAAVMWFALPCSVAGAQTGQGQGGRATIMVRGQDTLRLLVAPANENLLVMDHVMMIRRIVEALADFEREIRGPNRVEITRTAPAVFMGLQREALQHVSSLNVMCGSRRVARPAWLGVELSETGPNATIYPIVLGVEQKSPASVAGIQAQDTIVYVDGTDMMGRSVSEFVKQPGKRIEITVRREGALRKVQATLDSGRTIQEPATCEFARSMPYVKTLFDKDSTIAGILKVNTMNKLDSLRRRGQAVVAFEGGMSSPGLVVGGGGGGGIIISLRAVNRFGAVFHDEQRVVDRSSTKSEVSVLYVHENTNAAKAGLKSGDIVKRVAKKEVTTLAELDAEIRVLSSAKRPNVDLEVLRDGKLHSVTIQW